jgi:type IV pilus assembly protein PilA
MEGEEMETIKTAKGFTLIELLVVVAIIGVLAAIAIPQFSLYRQRAFNSTCQADAHNGGVAEESYYIGAQKYLAGACNTLPGFKGSVGVVCTAASSTTNFTVKTTHPQMSFTTGCTYNSSTNPSLICN